MPQRTRRTFRAGPDAPSGAIYKNVKRIHQDLYKLWRELGDEHMSLKRAGADDRELQAIDRAFKELHSSMKSLTDNITMSFSGQRSRRGWAASALEQNVSALVSVPQFDGMDVLNKLLENDIIDEDVYDWTVDESSVQSKLLKRDPSTKLMVAKTALARQGIRISLSNRARIRAGWGPDDAEILKRLISGDARAMRVLDFISVNYPMSEREWSYFVDGKAWSNKLDAKDPATKVKLAKAVFKKINKPYPLSARIP